jgi:hypothetical protein
VIRQPHGSWFTEVKPDKKFAPVSDAKGMVALPPHTDGNAERVPPCVVGLYCKSQSETPEATCVSSILAFMRTSCTRAEQHWMTTHLQQWSHKFESRGQPPVAAPVCAIIGGQPVFRWSTNLLVTGQSSPVANCVAPGFVPDEMAVSLATKLEAFVADSSRTVAVCAEAGDLLLIENHTRVHFRGPLKSMDRFFVRFWIA